MQALLTAPPKPDGPPVFGSPSFEAQWAFLEDTAPLKLSFCTRRAGKSYGVGLHLFRDAYRTPGCKVLYLAKTRASAKGIIWQDVLRPINRMLGLEAVPNLSELSWTLPNESAVYVLGADADEDERDKLLGQKYRTVAVDEAEAFRTDLAHLVYGTLRPAVADYRGQILLNGTPSNLKAGLFFELTAEQDASNPGRFAALDEAHGASWSGHRWSAFQNPHMAEKWAAEIEQHRTVNPDIDATPLFQQYYLGRWTVDDSQLVYRYQSGRNDCAELPDFHRPGWSFVLGIDLGFNDASAFTVGAYHQHDKRLYVVLSTKRAGLDITATSEEAERIKRRWLIDTVVVDGANKQAVEELNRRHGLGAQPADKTGKADFIDIMNAEYQRGAIQLGPDCESLREEYGALVWDERALAKQRKRVEHPSCENHCADSALYMWRWCWQYLATAAPPVRPAINTAEWHQQQQATARQELERYFERVAADNQRQQREDEWD